uniref:Uncharacterized protein n=1 Tax=Helianthus annuus TaxID=4232 RepID=A0A251SMK4_HELAN
MNPDALRTQTRPQLWKIEPIYRNHHHLFHLYNQTQLTEKYRRFTSEFFLHRTLCLSLYFFPPVLLLSRVTATVFNTNLFRYHLRPHEKLVVVGEKPTPPEIVNKHHDSPLPYHFEREKETKKKFSSICTWPDLYPCRISEHSPEFEVHYIGVHDGTALIAFILLEFLPQSYLYFTYKKSKRSQC